MLENLALASGGPLLKWSRWTFIAALALFPLFIIPAAWFPFQLAKIALFTLLLAASAVLYALDAWRNRSLSIPQPLMLGGVLLFLAATAVSTFLSQNQAASLFGEGIEVDTLLFAAILTMTFVMALLLVRSSAVVRTLWIALLSFGVLVALFQALQLAFPGFLSGSVFPSPSSNLVGRWNDLTIFMAFIASFSLLAIDLVRVRGKMLWLSGAAFALSAALLVMANLANAWWVVLIVALVSGAAAYFYTGALAAQSLRERIKALPVASLILVLLSAICLLWGGSISNAINQSLNVQEIEVRPSMSATVSIMSATYAQSTFTTLFGSGPSTFGEQWLMYKPAEVNLSAFWNVDFAMGSGAIPTMFITLGIVGGLAVLLIPLLIAISLWRLIRTGALAGDERAMASALGLSSLALFGLALAYPVGQLPLLLAFALSGAYAALAGASRVRSFSLNAAPVEAARILGYAALAVLVIVPVAAAGIVGQRFVGSFYLGQALAVADASDLDRAETNANRSISIRRTDDALRFLANIKVARAQAAVGATEGTQEARAQAFQASVADSVAYARAAVAEAPRDYTNWLALARIYEALIPVGVQGAYGSAQQTYVEAIRRNPRNPGLYLSAARMEGAAGQEQPLRDAVNQALALKPNYTDAVLLILQLEIAKNNLQGAIQASMAAVQTAPENAGLWLQLGLLALNANAPADAAIAFERALTLIPDYANAKYFLGLTYYQLGKKQEAVAIFTDLAAANPENAEVALILANMRAGKAPFAGAQPPVQNPTRPANPPIKEQ